MRSIELVDLDLAFGQSGQNLQFAAQGRNDFSQCGYLHIALLFDLRQTWLFHAKRLGDFLLALPRQLANFA